MAAPRLKLGEALGLGLLHGPAELAPVSSSGHITVVPYLAGWEYADLEPDLRKAFEVALHAGTAVALLIGLRGEVSATLSKASLKLAGLVLAATVTPAAVGYFLEGPIEERLGTPGSIAIGMIIGGTGLTVADQVIQGRTFDDADIRDGFWLGVAQACALMPGVSRNGATLTAARLRRFRRIDANVLSRTVALPVIGGATGLKLARLARTGLPEGAALPFTVGAVASFASTLASIGVLDQVERDRTLAPFGLYRVALGSVVLRRIRRSRGSGRPVGHNEPHE